jgi:SNF2 family DNA or RNA helicase
MGLGKTAQIIALICDTLERKPSSKVLIVVPNPLLENWRREFSFFAPKFEPYIHYGPNRRGLPDELIKHQIIISPYTTISSDISLFEDLLFDLTLFDEASMLKNPNSSRTLAAKRIKSSVKIAMTGTPVENSLVDAWSISDLVFPGYLGDKKSFIEQYVSKDLSLTLENNLEALESSLGQITLRRMKKDVLKQLPKKLDIHLPISMTTSEKSNYESIITEIKENCESGGSNVLALINKLQQFTAHPAQLDKQLPRDFNSLNKTSSKFELLFMHLSKIHSYKEKVLIFATFQDTIDLIASSIESQFGIKCGKIDGRTPNHERQSLIDDLAESDGFGVLVLHPRTAGMGLNITCANHVIHYSRQWNPALEEQATARAWRNGQTQIVSAYYLYFADTIEEDIDLRLRLKQELSDRVVSISESKETDKSLILKYLTKMEASENG